MKKRLLYLALITAFGVGSFGVSPVLAQDDDDDEDARDIDRIIVTGSRIDREGIDTFYPAITVDAQLLEDGAFTNVADALNQIPSFGAPVTPNFDQNTFSVGQNFVNFLGLGTQRTLTLVNGRRFVSSNVPIIFGQTGGLQVDFNVIPIALVDRIETIGVGGAPIYGSDAIAGTINVIMKDRYEGLDFTARTGVTAENDAKFHEMVMAAGTNFADGRGNVMISAQWFTQDELCGTCRPDIRAQTLFSTEAGNQIVRDGRTFNVARLIYDNRIVLVSHGGSAAPAGAQLIPQFGLGAFPDGNFYRFSPNGTLNTYAPGSPRPDNNAINAMGGDGETFFDEVQQLRSPLERGVWTLGMNYDITPDIQMSGDFLFSHSYAEELVNQGGFQTWAFGGTSGALQMSTSNPFLTQQARDVFAANGMTTFSLHRFMNDLIDSGVQTKQNVRRVNWGLDGEFFVADRRFNWQLYWVHGKSEAEIRTQGINDGRFLNAIDAYALTAADLAALTPGQRNQLAGLSGTATTNAGDIICRAVLQMVQGTVTPPSGSGVTMLEHPFVNGCVPLNLFGEGAFFDAAQNWVIAQQINVSDISQTVYNANIAGSVMDLPAGPLGFALGYERRSEKASFTPGAGSALPLDRSSTFAPTGGEFDTDEYFLEVRIPFISPGMDIPFLRSFEGNAAVREIDNSIAGSATTWTAGGTLSPVRDLTFRGNYTESIRAPSLAELFAPQNSVFSFANDPCDNRFVGVGPAPQTRLANCTAELGGIPGGYNPGTFVSNIVNATARGKSGGNPGLQNESAEAWSVGLTFEPRWVDNLVITADYIDIELDDAIVSLNLSTVMQGCYDSSQFPGAPQCGQFERDANGQIVDFLTGQTNAQVFQLRKLEIGAFYNWFMDGIGEFAFNSRLSETRHRATVLQGAPSPNAVGGFNDPRWAGTFDFIWNDIGGNHRVFWRVGWQDRALFSPAGTTIFFFENRDRSNRTELDRSSRHRFIHNISYSYRMPAVFTGMPNETILQFNVNNAFDRTPNEVERAAGHFGVEEMLGRNYVLSIRGRF